MFPCFNLFLLVSLIHSQTIDPKSTSEQICISDSVDDNVNGIYYYFSWDSDINGSTYYNYQTNRYLYPWIDASSKYYFVSSDRTRAVGSYCRLSIISKLILNPRDCLSPWQSFNDTQLVNGTNLNGTYKWAHFNRTTRSSVYHCSDCSSSLWYLYGWIYSYGSYWRIGSDYKTSAGWSYCNLGIQDDAYIFNLEDCFSWHAWYNETWNAYEDVTAYKCVSQTPDPKSTSDQMCISDSVNSQMNGIYYYSSWDSVVNEPIYYNYETNRYLYPWINASVKYYFVSTDHTQAIGSYCRLPMTTKPLLNPSDCFTHWQSFNGTQFVNDKDLTLVNCNDICVSGNDHSALDGTYKWLHFDPTIRTSVYQCTDCPPLGSWTRFYLYGWIYSSGPYFRIGSDYNTSSAWSSCRLPIQADRYDFNPEDCPAWSTWSGTTWNKEHDIVQKCITPSCFKKTLFYGGLGGDVLDVWNQTQIIGISSWGSFQGIEYPYHKSLGSISWISSGMTGVQSTVGSGSNITSCKSFLLDANDYIHGYRIIYDAFVYGLYFYTVNNRSFHCIPQDVDITEHSDSGIVLFERHYLSGFIFRSNEIIDAISFAFTGIDDDCTLEPTSAPFTPTTNPSYPMPTSSPITMMFPSLLFGFETASRWGVTTDHSVTITLYWEGSIFQCHVFPTEYETYYGCDTSNAQTTTQCDAETVVPPVPHGMQIDNEGWRVIINKLVIQHQQSEYSNNTIYEIVNFCSDPPCDDDAISDTFTVECLSVMGQSMLVVLDINDTSQPALTEHIEWTKEYFDFQCIPMGYCIDAITTPSYGSTAPSARSIDINQGRINAIPSWSINAYRGVTNMKWISDEQTSFNDNYGYVTRYDNNKCANFTLDDDDYINGYRVIYNNDTVRGLTFYAKKGGLHQCISNDLADGQEHSGDIIYPDRYLSGFYVSSGTNIYTIAFQFTHVNNTNICPNITNTSNPTMEPTGEPTSKPTADPTAPLSTDDIIIITHDDISRKWIAFNISNLNLSCGGIVHSVEITDAYLYENIWVNYSTHSNNYYEFNSLSGSFRAPISVRIIKRDVDDQTDETITGLNVIQVLKGGREFVFGDNFCRVTQQSETTSTTSSPPDDVDVIGWTFYYMAGIVFVFIAIGGIALLDAKYIRKNDYFKSLSIVSSLFQILDMLSDVFFVVAVYATYRATDDDKLQFLLICILSMVCIVIPIIISLYQLYATSSTQWITDNRVVEWLNTYAKLLYFMSVFTGSSFAALDLFNCNMFSLNLFDMGLSKKHFQEFKTKKLYSIILGENCPQLILSAWYTILLGELDYIPAAQMVFSSISIIVTVIAVILQKRISDNQDSLYITIDIQGQMVMDKLKICKNRIKKIKSYLAQSVLGVNIHSVQIQKPFGGSLVNGLRLHIHVSRVHNTSHRYLAHHYEVLLQNAI
eukprot:626725_1